MGRPQQYVQLLFSEYSSDFLVSDQYSDDDDDDDSNIVKKEHCKICSESGKSEIWYAYSVCCKLTYVACSRLSTEEEEIKEKLCLLVLSIYIYLYCLHPS